MLSVSYCKTKRQIYFGKIVKNVNIKHLNEKSTIRQKQVILKCGLQSNKTSHNMTETKITEFLWFLPRVS